MSSNIWEDCHSVAKPSTDNKLHQPSVASPSTVLVVMVKFDVIMLLTIVPLKSNNDDITVEAQV